MSHSMHLIEERIGTYGVTYVKKPSIFLSKFSLNFFVCTDLSVDLALSEKRSS